MADASFPIQEFPTLVKPLVGLTVSLPWKGYGSTIYLELGALSPIKSNRQHHNEGKACISVEWDWRVESGASILYGSSNSRPKIERGIGSLLDAKIQDLFLLGEVPELVVRFSNGHCLRSFAMATGDPEWAIKLPSGSWVWAKDGTLLVGECKTRTTDEEVEVFAFAERTAMRWGVPCVEAVSGLCAHCAWYVPLDGEGFLLDYGACVATESPFDGRIVNCGSGCPCFSADDET